MWNGDYKMRTLVQVEVIDGEINVKIPNTSAWQPTIKSIKDNEEFYAKIKRNDNTYIKDANGKDRHGKYLNIKNILKSNVPEKASNQTPTKIYKPDVNAARYEPCKFEVIKITESEVKDGKANNTTITVFGNGKGLLKKARALPQEKIERKFFFKFDSTVIDKDGEAVLNNILKFLLEHTGSTMNLQGHACVIGKQNYNKGLSQRRADVVKKFFADGGLEAGRIISVGKGEVDPTDDKQGRDNIKYKNEKDYENNRRVDISFISNTHDAQTIIYNVIAPSMDTKKLLTIDIVGQEAKACFRAKDKHTKETWIVDVGQAIDKGDTKHTFITSSFNYKVYSDLSRFNLFPIQYIWPMATNPNQFHLHTHSCRWFSEKKNTTVLIKAYPDIKWELAFEFLINVSNYKATKMPPGNIYAKHQEKSREAGYKRWRMNEAGKVPISIGVGLAAEWNNGVTKRSFTNEFSDRIQLAASFIARVIGILQDVINFAQSTAKTTGIPVAFDIRYPKLTFVGKWYLERQETSKVLGTTGEINLGLKPIIGAEVIIDILGCAITALSYGLTGNPAAAKLIDKFRKGIEKIGGVVTFTATFYGELEIEMEALKIIGGKVSIDGKTTIGGKMGVKILLAIEVGGKFNSNRQRKIIDFRAEARLEGEAFFGGDFIINSDDKGLYYQPVVKFSGVIIMGTVEGEVGWWKSSFKMEERALDKSEYYFEKHYI